MSLTWDCKRELPGELPLRPHPSLYPRLQLRLHLRLHPQLLRCGATRRFVVCRFFCEISNFQLALHWLIPLLNSVNVEGLVRSRFLAVLLTLLSCLASALCQVLPWTRPDPETLAKLLYWPARTWPALTWPNLTSAKLTYGKSHTQTPTKNAAKQQFDKLKIGKLRVKMEIDFFGKCHWNFTKRISIALWPDVQSLRELSVAQTDRERYICTYIYSICRLTLSAFPALCKFLN